MMNLGLEKQIQKVNVTLTIAKQQVWNNFWWVLSIKMAKLAGIKNW
jgi:hypothetical protein